MRFSTTLFLALPIEGELSLKLGELPVDFYRSFVNPTTGYIEEYEEGETLFLGKPLGKKVSLSALNEASIHLLSVMRRLIPDENIKPTQLRLLSIPTHGN